MPNSDPPLVTMLDPSMNEPTQPIDYKYVELPSTPQSNQHSTSLIPPSLIPTTSIPADTLKLIPRMSST